MRHYYSMWLFKVVQTGARKDALDRCLMRIRRRIVRNAFKKYKYNMTATRQDEFNLGRVNEAKAHLRFKLKRLVFSAFQEFVHNHTKARDYLRRVLFRLDFTSKRTAFLKWEKYGHRKTEKMLITRQNTCVS